MKISTIAKHGIKDKLEAYAKRAGSQNKAATKLDVSTATISHIINDQWDQINDAMWRHIASLIGYSTSDWTLVKTRDFKRMTGLLQDAQKNSNVFAVIGSAGSGKSVSLTQYEESHERVYRLQCAEFWNRKYFLSKLLTAMGIDSAGYRVADMMEDIVRNLKKQHKPLIIMDEADKLPDQVLHFFITLYNQLEDHCGIILCATSHLKKRIDHGRKNNKKGYREIYSRIGCRFQTLQGIGSVDVNQICQANGIADAKAIKDIFDDSDEDLRRVKIKIHAYKMIQNQTEQN